MNEKISKMDIIGKRRHVKISKEGRDTKEKKRMTLK